ISATVPDAAARIGVPLGTPMSMPGWQDSQARDSQKGEVIGPLTGQISPPEPGRTGPATGALEIEASRAWIRSWALRSEATSSSSWCRRVREEASSEYFAERADWIFWRRSTSVTRTEETSPRSDWI